MLDLRIKIIKVDITKLHVDAIVNAANGIRAIAFPAISTGAYRFPIEKATRIALTEVNNFLKSNTTLEKVIFVRFNEKTYTVYQD